MKVTPKAALAAVVAWSASGGAAGFDEAAAKAMYRSPANNCSKCHALDKEKIAPSYHQIAEKYKGDPEAERKLIEHINSGRLVKFPDGHEEEHRVVKETDPEQQRNLIQWILAQ
ncbi:MAG TPA: c-type cytochrome [Rhodocyclaceae bacterium]|nr:c-type cytochrome [Rhodocyclaceae bacterium]